jgi:hypothetical protein
MGDSSDLFDDPIRNVGDTYQQSDVLVNTGDSSNFFDALISSRNVIYPPEDTHLQHFCQMDTYQASTLRS